VATIAFDEISPDFERAELRLEGLKPPVASFELRVFADQPGANAGTPTLGNPHYLGSQFFYGLGVDSAPQKSDAIFREDRLSQSAPTQIRLNISDGLRSFLSAAQRRRATLTFVTVDRDGKEISSPDLDFEGISIIAT
jgi:hypothetical protein